MVIAYLRVGTSNKELLEEQKDEIERYASNHDMNVDKWITDVTVDKGREDERNLAFRIFPAWDELCRKLWILWDAAWKKAFRSIV